MFAAPNSRIDSRSSSVSAAAHGSEFIAGDESGVPVTQILHEVESVCGSNAAESAASMAGLSLPSSDGVTSSGSRAEAVAGSISWV